MGGNDPGLDIYCVGLLLEGDGSNLLEWLIGGWANNKSIVEVTYMQILWYAIEIRELGILERICSEQPIHHPD